jgi:hypothetical protein
MALDLLRLLLTRLDEAWIRHPGAVHDDAKTEELVQRRHNEDQCDEQSACDLQNRANHLLSFSTARLQTRRYV